MEGRIILARRNHHRKEHQAVQGRVLRLGYIVVSSLLSQLETKRENGSGIILVDKASKFLELMPYHYPPLTRLVLDNAINQPPD